ncbi:hypothetical protein [Saccharothrix variisporea]|uniref:Uncharacterized protein n=1 Tax=Saccharothrix variisporea TaxID=543527 RepID=A0A495XDG9_9PSEU|nr:hypothetical protein [Saccharothrix variisporea]RKT72062.1 hypothetical protein DFJ66_5367 [Saccharothrix variisporea]
MSEIWIALAALALGVVLGLVIRHKPARRRPRPDPAARNHVREVLNAADDLEYGLNTVLNFGPLSASELISVDLPAKLERLAGTGGVDRATLHDLRTHTQRIALHPYPEPRDLLTAVREDDASVWLVLREAVGSGAAQHQAAAKARECLDVIRNGLRDTAPREMKELVSV